MGTKQRTEYLKKWHENNWSKNKEKIKNKRKRKVKTTFIYIKYLQKTLKENNIKYKQISIIDNFSDEILNKQYEKSKLMQ